MGKGFFTQGIAVLFESAPSIDAVAHALRAPIVARRDAMTDPWLSGPAVHVDYPGAPNGRVMIDVVDHPWPDHMGSREEPTLFGAWSMGHLGPFSYPGSLARAVAQAWHLGEPPVDLVERHGAFVRLRLSYIFGVGAEAPVIPDGVDPGDELAHVHELARDLFAVPGALALFNPNGEMLFDEQAFLSALARAADDDSPPVDLWTNVRLFRLDGVVDGWSMMDTVGMRQLDLPDLEACFPASIDPRDAARLLRNLSLYYLERGDVIQQGHTIDGPGGRWRAHRRNGGLSDPPRDIVRFLPPGAEPQVLVEPEERE